MLSSMSVMPMQRMLCARRVRKVESRLSSARPDIPRSNARQSKKAARSVPVVLASNFSIGVNALFALTRRAAEILGDEFDRKIIETHHRMKKDAPSGTAKTIAEILRADGAGEISIQSVREGEIVGEHTVIFAGPGERLELSHHAESRAIFARGALRAARWIVGQPPGLYSMQDVLGLTRDG